MIIWGWGRRTRKDEGLSKAYNCPNCRNVNRFRLLTVKRWFTLFFIPIIPYETSHLELCPVCNQGRKISKVELLALQQEALHDQTYITGGPAAISGLGSSDPSPQNPANPSQIQQ